MLTVRIDEDSQFDLVESQPLVPWWSFTKTVLAVCALLLVSESKLSLDNQIQGRTFTLRQLLQHRAGVRSYSGLASYHRAVANDEVPWSVEQLFKEVEVEQLAFVPNQGWSYSNVGYVFVRQMIEAATGSDLQSAIAHIVFEPFGLRPPKLATRPEDLNGTVWGNKNHYHPGWVYHGLLVGSARDATTLLHLLMSGYVLPPALLADMTIEYRIGGQLSGRPWNSTGYGLGLMMGETPAGYAIGHSGCGPDSANAIYHFPERKYPCTISAFSQSQGESMAEHEVVRLAGNSGC